MSKASETNQVTFGEVSVTPISKSDFSGDMQCDGTTGFDEDGNPDRCPYDAAIGIIRPGNEYPEFYCRIHSRDSWLEMAGID